MTAVWAFVDEQGDPKFGARNSEWFGLAAVFTDRPAELSAQVDRLRYELWSDGHIEQGYFHAQDDCWLVRRAFIDLIAELPLLRIDVVALRKERVFPHLRSPDALYRSALRLLMRYSSARLGNPDKLNLVLSKWKPYVDNLPDLARDALTKETNQRRAVVSSRERLTVFQVPCAAHPGLQVADYVAWISNRARTGREGEFIARIRASVQDSSDFSAFQ